MKTTDAATHGQVQGSAAEIYESFFVPALFEQWTQPMLGAAGLSPGDDVLDVGCGTGILARAAARQLDGSGSVTGVDVNAAMLDVARTSPEPVQWKQGAAEDLPFPSGSFDRVVSQFALMFFADQQAGLREMSRVVRPGGSVTIATWASIDESHGYAAMVDLLQRLFGDEAAEALRAPFTVGTVDAVHSLVADVTSQVSIERHEGEARFDSLEAWVHTDVRGWTLANIIDDDQYNQLLEAAAVELAEFVDNAGRVRFAAPALIASCVC